MPGGPKEAYNLIEPILVKCAAQVGDEACTGYRGPIGAGNYVKMVHNGIEYDDWWPDMGITWKPTEFHIVSTTIICC